MNQMDNGCQSLLANLAEESIKLKNAVCVRIYKIYSHMTLTDIDGAFLVVCCTAVIDQVLNIRLARHYKKM